MPKTLKPEDRSKLDGIVQNMIANKEPESNIQFVVNDFKNKYGVDEPIAANGGAVVEKKSQDQTTSKDAGVDASNGIVNTSQSKSNSASTFGVEPLKNQTENPLVPKPFQQEIPTLTPTQKAAAASLQQTKDAENDIKSWMTNPDAGTIDANKPTTSKYNNAKAEALKALTETSNDLAIAGGKPIDVQAAINNPENFPDVVSKIKNYYDKKIAATIDYTYDRFGEKRAGTERDNAASLALKSEKDKALKNIGLLRDIAIVKRNPDATPENIGSEILKSDDPIAYSNLQVAPNMTSVNYRKKKMGLEAKLAAAALDIESGTATPETVAKANKIVQDGQNLVYDFPDIRKGQLRQMVMEQLATKDKLGGFVNDEAAKKALGEIDELIANPVNPKDVPLLKQMKEDLDFGLGKNIMSDAFVNVPNAEAKYNKYLKEREQYKGQSALENFGSGLGGTFTETAKWIAGKTGLRDDKERLTEADNDQIGTKNYDPKKYTFQVPKYTVDVNKDSPTRGQMVANPDAGDFNLRTVPYKAMNGLGQLTGQLALGELVGAGVAGTVGRAIELGGEGVSGVVGSANSIMNASTAAAKAIEMEFKVMAPAYAMSYDQNRKEGLKMFGSDEAAAWKVDAYSNAASMLEGLTEKIGNPYEQFGMVKSVFKAEVKDELAKNIAGLSIKQIENLSRPTIEKFLTGAVKAVGKGAKNVTGEASEEWLNAYGQYGAAAVLGADVSQRSGIDEANHAFMDAMASMSFLGAAGTFTGARDYYSNSGMSQQAMFDIGSNADTYRDAINSQFANGILSEKERDTKLNLVNSAEVAKADWNDVKQYAKPSSDVTQAAKKGVNYVQARTNEIALQKEHDLSTNPVKQQKLAAQIKKWQNVQQALIDMPVDFNTDAVPVLPAVAPNGFVEVRVGNIYELPPELQAQAVETVNQYGLPEFVFFVPNKDITEPIELDPTLPEGFDAAKTFANQAAARDKANNEIQTAYQDNVQEPDAWVKPYEAARQLQEEGIVNIGAEQGTVIEPPTPSTTQNEELSRKLGSIRNDDFMRQYFNEEDHAAYEKADEAGKVELIRAKKEQLLSPIKTEVSNASPQSAEQQQESSQQGNIAEHARTSQEPEGPQPSTNGSNSNLGSETQKEVTTESLVDNTVSKVDSLLKEDFDLISEDIDKIGRNGQPINDAEFNESLKADRDLIISDPIKYVNNQLETLNEKLEATKASKEFESESDRDGYIKRTITPDIERYTEIKKHLEATKELSKTDNTVVGEPKGSDEISKEDLGSNQSFTNRFKYKLGDGELEISERNGRYSVTALEVGEGSRRKGVATKLLQKAIADTNGNISAQVSNDGSAELHYKLGMRAYKDGKLLSLEQTKKEIADHTSVNMRFSNEKLEQGLHEISVNRKRELDAIEKENSAYNKNQRRYKKEVADLIKDREMISKEQFKEKLIRSNLPQNIKNLLEVGSLEEARKQAMPDEDVVKEKYNAESEKLLKKFPTEPTKTPTTKKDTVVGDKTAETEIKNETKVTEAENIKPTEETGTANKEADTDSSGTEPPKETKAEPAAESNDGVKITHAATEAEREAMNLPEREKHTEKENATLLEEADKVIKEGYNVAALINKILNTKHVRTDLEAAILSRYIATLKAEISNGATNEQIETYKDALAAAEKGGSEAGAALQAQKLVSPIDDSLADFFIRDLAANMGAPLTDLQKAATEKEYADITAAKKAYEEKIAALEAENAKLKAQKEFDKNKPKSKPTDKKTHEDYTKERNKIVDSLKEKLAKANQQTYAALPLVPQLIAIAPDVAKLVKSYVEEGVTALADVVSNIHGVLKDNIEGITEKDVHDIIAGEYNRKQKTRGEVTKAIIDLREQAKLQNKLDALLAGQEPKVGKQKIKRNQEIERLRQDISDFKKQKADSERAVIEAKEKAEKDIAKAQKDAENAATKAEKEAAKEAERKAKEDLKEANKKTPEQIALQTIKTRTANEIKALEAELNSGNLIVEKPKREPIKLDKEATDLKDKLIKLKQEREIRILKQQYAMRNGWQKAGDLALEVLNVPRTIMASADLSAPLRQGLVPSIAHPTVAAKAFVEMFQQAVSQKRFDRWFFDLRETPEYKVMDKAGLYVADPHNPKLTAKEEAFMNNLAEKIPLIGKLIKGSERAYISYLNKMRVDLFQKGVDAFEAEGKTIDNSPELYKALASWVNNSTGRGGLGPIEAAAPVFNSVFFSPRLIASRFNLLNPVYYAKLPKEVRVRALVDMAKFIGLGTSILALVSLAGGDDKDDATVEFDPRSTDFAKIKIGNKRYDIWGGFQPFVRVMAQLISGKGKSIKTGKINDLTGEGPFGRDRGDVLSGFFRGKLAPVPSSALNLIIGRNIIGEEATLQTEAERSLLPLIVSDVKEAMKDEGAAAILTTWLPATFGVGVQNFDTDAKTSKKKETVKFNGGN